MPKKHVPRPIGGRIDKICKCCGKPFTIFPVRTLDERRVYCSDECRSIANEGNGEFRTTICLHCGLEFTWREATWKKPRKFCSAHCVGKYNAAKYEFTQPLLEPRPCVVCGTIFRPAKKRNPNSYCSQECRKQLYETPGTCEHCGKDFVYLGRLYREDENGDKKPRRFCSKKCQHAAAAKLQQEKLNALGDVRCVLCYKQIPFKGNITERSIRRYCTRKCCSTHQKYKNLRYCKWCGKRFSVAGTTNEGRARKRKPGLQQCCSHECYLASIDKNREGYRQLKTKICPMCNKPFTYHDTYAQSTRTYCSPLCKVQATFKRRNGHE